MLVQVCLNGARAPAEHPRLPVTPAALADEAHAAVRAGAGDIHLHVRGPEGTESLHPDAVRATVAAIRARVPGTQIGISTGTWIEKDDERRLAYIAAWDTLPDHASVNMGEPGAPATLGALHRRGITIEIGLMTVADAERMVRLRLHPLALRLAVECDAGSVAASMAETDAILAVLRREGVSKPVSIHGMGEAAWPFVERAAREGYSTRIGMEDTLTLPDGSPATGNADLVAAAVAIMRGAAAG